MARLAKYEWPGNVRELENVYRASGGDEHVGSDRPEDLPESLLEREPAPGVDEARYHAAVKDLKKRLIKSAIEEAGELTEAARALGVHPNYLHRLIRNLEIRGIARQWRATTAQRIEGLVAELADPDP